MKTTTRKELLTLTTKTNKTNKITSTKDLFDLTETTQQLKQSSTETFKLPSTKDSIFSTLPDNHRPTFVPIMYVKPYLLTKTPQIELKINRK